MSRYYNPNLYRYPGDPEYDNDFDESQAEEDYEQSLIDKAEFQRQEA